MFVSRYLRCVRRHVYFHANHISAITRYADKRRTGTEMEDIHDAFQIGYMGSGKLEIYAKSQGGDVKSVILAFKT